MGRGYDYTLWTISLSVILSVLCKWDGVMIKLSGLSPCLFKQTEQNKKEGYSRRRTKQQQKQQHKTKGTHV